MNFQRMTEGKSFLTSRTEVPMSVFVTVVVENFHSFCFKRTFIAAEYIIVVNFEMFFQKEFALELFFALRTFQKFHAIHVIFVSTLHPESFTAVSTEEEFQLEVHNEMFQQC